VTDGSDARTHERRARALVVRTGIRWIEHVKRAEAFP
jgi:hypothetical protein